MEDIKEFINTPIKYTKKNYMKIKPIHYNQDKNKSFNDKYIGID